MKFQIVNRRLDDKSRNQPVIEIYTFDIVEPEKVSILKHWMTLGIAALAGCLLTGAGCVWFCQQDLSKLEVELKTDRSTTVVLRSKDEQERNGKGSDGIAPASD